MSLTRRTVVAALAVATLAGAGALTASTTASATPPNATYSITTGTRVANNKYNDTPNASYIDKDGTFYTQNAAALYGANDPRHWDFYSGANHDTATRNSISDAVNPANSNDRNNNTTWRCNNSPTGLESTYQSPAGRFAQKNYCDLMGVWVDPDTGNWYGMVHNEFTPAPFGDASFSHYDAIDLAVSTNQGRVWSIVSHAITSPYSTLRNDSAAFPNQTYLYGAGDPRLFVDPASGYFYVYYNSRVLPKAGVGGGDGFRAHVARAPMSQKMAAGSWQKWYNGTWSQPGVGGLESNMVPVNGASSTGYTPPANDYKPSNVGTVAQQIAAGTTPAKSDLFLMHITYNAYLGLYLAEPEVQNQSVATSQKYFVTDDLTTQKWYYIGDSGTFKTDSWYRWFLDGANRTSGTIIGRTYRSYCAFFCAGPSAGGSEYHDVTINSSSPAPAPVDLTRTYTIGSGSGRVLAQVSGSSATTSVGSATGSNLEAWSFAALGDGSYRITNAATGQALGIDAGSMTTRAWGTRPTVSASTGSVGQQWFVVRNDTGGYRLVNRYSQLVLGMSADSTRLAETTPHRAWTNTTGNPVGGNRTAAEQLLTFTLSGTPGQETVTVTNPGARTSTVGTAITPLQISGTDSQGKPLTYSATGLPAGLAISSSGLVTGTPTATGTSTVTVTASSGTATGQTSFTWTVNPPGGNLNGTHTLKLASGNALDVTGASTSAGARVITSTPTGATNQNWVFTQQADGSYTVVNGRSNLCAGVSASSTAPGASVIQWTCIGVTDQRWRATQLPNGLYTLTNVNSGMLLTTASTTSGAVISQQANTNSPLQQWIVS